MTKQTINIGATANDKSGDPLRTAFSKVNANFTELYTLVGGTSAALQELAQDYASPMFTHSNNTGITFTYDDANNKLIASVTVLPSQTGHAGEFLTTDGTSTVSWGTPTVSLLTHLSGTAKLETNNSRVIFSSGIGLELFGGTALKEETSSTVLSAVQSHPFKLRTKNSINTIREWSFGDDGILHLPAGGDIFNSNGLSVLENNATTDRLVNGTDKVVLNQEGATRLSMYLNNVEKSRLQINTNDLLLSSLAGGVTLSALDGVGGDWYFRTNGELHSSGGKFLSIAEVPAVFGSLDSPLPGANSGTVTIKSGTGTVDGGSIYIQAGTGGTGNDGEVSIKTGTTPYEWLFDNGGILTVPGRITLGTDAFILGYGDFAGLYPSSTSGSTGLELDAVNDALLVGNRNVVIRANGDSPWKSWTFDNNGNLTIPGEIHGQQLTGFGGTPNGRAVNITPADNASDKKFKFRVDQYGETFTRAYLDMPEAQNNKQVAISFPHANSTVGYIFTQGANTSDDGLNNAFNIFYNAGDIKLTAMTPGTGAFKTWKFGTDGILNIPGSIANTAGPLELSGRVALPGRTNSSVYWDGNSVYSQYSQVAFRNSTGIGMSIDGGNSPNSIDIGDNSTGNRIKLLWGAGTVTGNSGDIEFKGFGSAISITPNNASGGSFTFNNNGSLTFPDATVQTTAFSTDPTLNVLRIDDGVHERFQTKTNATGIVQHNCALGHIFYHTSPGANWTANFTNINLDSNYATAVTLVIIQGGTGYYPSAVQIGGVAQTLNWQGNATPTPSTNRTDVVTFSIINNSGTYTVLGQLTGF